MSDCRRQYKLLVWKNWCEKTAKPHRHLTILIAPFLFGIVLILTSHSLDMSEWNPKLGKAESSRRFMDAALRLLLMRQEVLSEKTDFKHNALVPRMIIGYAPRSNGFYKEVMASVEDDIKHMEFRSFENCVELRDAVKDDFYFAGVCFLNNQRQSNPLEVNFTLYFPETIRIYNPQFIGFRWYTDFLQDPSVGFHFRPAISGGTLTYIDEGFLSLQHFISMQCIAKVKRMKETLPKVVIQRFPYNMPSKRVLMQNFNVTLPLCIMIAFAYPVITLTKAMVEEKEAKLRLIIKLMNASNWVVFCARLTIDIPILFLCSLLLVAIFTVRWDGESALLNNTNAAVILFLMFAYNVATFCFCYLLSTFFKNTIITPLILFVWIVTQMPYFLYSPSNGETLACKIGTGISLNCLMGKAFRTILDFEKSQHTFSWENIFQQNMADDVFSVGFDIGLLYINSVFYALLGLFLDGRNWSILLHITWWIRKRIRKQKPFLYARRYTHSFKGAKTEVYEIEPEYKTLTMQLTKVCKDYFGNRILNNISLNMYEGEITILRGHNGCGKSVLIKMIAGLVRPTSGTIMIHNCDITRNQDYLRSTLGIVISGSMLFNGLTVSKQLYFFSRMKGLNIDEAKFEVEKYLSAMDLVDQRNVLTEDLTLGLRQYLAVCCALAGQSKIVILEEPSSYMDLSATRLLYQLLISEKKGRTILMTTHSLDETEAVADRVAIMSNGKLRCSGSPYFLKEVYGREFRLNCRKGDMCDTESVTKAVRVFVPDVSPEYELARELCYLLENKYVGVFTDIINALEEQAETLDLKSYSINESTLEDIFFQKGVEFSKESNRHRHSDIMSGKGIYAQQYEHLRFLDKYQPLRGLRLWINVARAIFLKRFTISKRNSLLTAVQYSLPIVFILFVVALADDIKEDRLEMMNYNIRQYKNTKTTLELSDENPVSKRISDEYEESIFWIGLDHTVEYTRGQSFSDHVIREQSNLRNNFNQHYIIGATISSTKIVAWYNDFMLHSAPLSLNMVHNAILRYHSTKYNFIAVNFEPVHSKMMAQSIFRYSQNSLGKIYALFVSFSIFIVWTYPIIYIARERISRFFFLQISTGVSPILFWLFSFLYCVMEKLIITSCLIVGIYCLAPSVVGNPEVIGFYFFAILSYGIAMNIWNYYLATWFLDSTTAYSFISILNFSGSIIFFGISEMCYTGDSQPLELNEQYMTLFSLFPSFKFNHVLSDIYDYGRDILLCKAESMEVISKTLEDCEGTPACCDDKFRVRKDAIVSTIGIGFLHGCALLGIIFISYRVCVYIRNRRITNQNVENSRLASYVYHKQRHEDAVADTAYEKIRVLKMSGAERNNKPLYCEKMGKFFWKTPAIYGTYLAVDRGECIGLLGVNGSGKSLLLKLMAGVEKISFGSCLMYGSHIGKATMSHVGYCPEYNPFLEELTCCEAMKIICLLYGVPTHLISGICENLSKVMGFYPHYTQLICTLGSGSKRRLSCAVAMLGQPSLLLLDNPASSMDPAGKRQLWNLIRLMNKRGVAVIMSTLHPMAFEIISDRVAIISEGILQCLGNPYYLTDKYAKGYFLKVKIRDMSHSIRHSVAPQSGSVGKPFVKVLSFMALEFPDCQLRDQRGNCLYFLLPFEGNTAMSIYDTMQRNALVLKIEDFAVTRNNLVLAFVDVADHAYHPPSLAEI